MEPYTLDDLRQEIALMREENYLYARAAVATSLATVLAVHFSDEQIADMATALIDEAKENAARKVK